MWTPKDRSWFVRLGFCGSGAVGERGGNGLEDGEEVRAAHRSEEVSVATELELYGIWGRAR